jgi:hypothetical protein
MNHHYNVYTVSRLNGQRHPLLTLYKDTFEMGDHLVSLLKEIPGLYCLNPGLDYVTHEADRHVLVRDGRTGRPLAELIPTTLL